MNAKVLKSYMELQKLIAGKFRQAYKSDIIVWGNTGSPTLILAGFDEDLVPVYPQLRNSLQGERYISRILQVASDQGYNPDLCSDLRCDIGAQLVDDDIRPRIPKPDIILGMNFTCNSTVGLYNSWIRSHPDAHHYILDSPHTIGENVMSENVSYIKRQLQELIELIQKTYGIAFSMEKFRKAAACSAKTLNYMNKIITLSSHKPSPICMTSFQPFLLPLAYYSHYDDTFKFLSSLEKELQHIIASEQLKEEKIRLCWDFLPINKYMDDIGALLIEYDARIVIGTSLTIAMEWPDPVLFEKTDDPLGLLAYAYAQHHYKRNFKYKENVLSDWIKTYDLDGIIFHSARSCKAHSLTHFLVKERLEEKWGIPTVVVEADIMDPGAYSKSQILNRLEAFLEYIYREKGLS